MEALRRPGRRRGRARAASCRVRAVARYVDGRIATVGELAEVGARFVDLHGQNDHQSLLSPCRPAQRARSLRGRGSPRRARCAASGPRWRDAPSAPSSTGSAATRGPAHGRSISLRFQITEIDDARPRRHERGRHARGRGGAARRRRRASRRAHRGLRSDRGRGARRRGARRRRARRPACPSRHCTTACERCRRSSRTSSASCGSPSRRSPTTRCASTRCAPAAGSCASSRGKYGDTLTEVVAFAAAARARLAELEGFEVRAAELETARRARGARRGRGPSAVGGTPRRRSRPRRRGRRAPRGAGDACGPHRGARGTGHAPATTAPTTSPSCWRRTRASRPGRSARAASGGELARAMLALRVVLSEAPPTLVFDEVDAGIGGEAGTAVGRLLGDLGGRHQVLCVTHLAQVAAFADAQVAVEKQEREGSDGGAPWHARSHGDERGSPSCRGCSPGWASRRTRAATPPSCSQRAGDLGPRPRGARPWPADAPPARGAAATTPVRGSSGRRGSAGAPRISSSGSSRARSRSSTTADLDRVAADSLVGRGVAAVVNAAPSISGRYPNGGPIRVVRRGHPAPRRRRRRRDGPRPRRRRRSSIDDGEVRRGDELVATRRDARRTTRSRRRWSRPRGRSASSSSGSPTNTLEYIEHEAKPDVRAARAAAAAHEVQGPARARRRARSRLPRRPAGAAAVHPRVPAGADRRRRRRRRAARDGLQARHHHRRLRLAVRARAWHAAPSSCTTCIPTGGRPGARTCSSGASHVPRVRRRGHERGRRDAARVRGRRARSSSPSARTRRWSSSSTRAGAGMASTFLTRLRLGPVLVDAKGVSRLYEGRVRRRDMASCSSARRSWR